MKAPPRPIAGRRSVLLRFRTAVLGHPLRLVGLVLGVGLSGLIVLNAAFLQTKRHPAPLFAAVHAPPSREAAMPATSAPIITASIPAAKSPIRSIQEGLARTGFYDGPLDGVAGPRTTAAIMAFEKSQKLPPTGQPSEAVLARLQQAGPPIPVPRPKVVGRASDSSSLAER